MTLRLWLVEDDEAARWHPFSLTRPVSELLFGTCRLRERAERALGMPAAGTAAPAALEGFEEEGSPPVVRPDRIPAGEPRILLSSRAALPVAGPDARAAREAVAQAPRDRPVRIAVGGHAAGWLLPAGPAPTGRVDDPPGIELPGTLLEAPWSLMAANAAAVHADLTAGPPPGAGPLPVHHRAVVVGDHPVSVGEGVSVEPGAVLDTREGPIHLDERVSVGPFTHLRGPAFIGPASTLLGGSLGAVSVGPVCRVRGEVEEAVILGYANKAHDGYLGHALVGRWVNLGAFTTNSDLKNNYGSVRVPRGPEEETDTGLLKVGVFLGDHVKTGIGTLLNTGTVVGAGSNVFGGRMPPRWVPPFSWGEGEDLVPFRLDRFLDVAERAMGRRGVELSEGMRALLERAWHRGREGGS